MAPVPNIAIPKLLQLTLRRGASIAATRKPIAYSNHQPSNSQQRQQPAGNRGRSWRGNTRPPTSREQHIPSEGETRYQSTFMAEHVLTSALDDSLSQMMGALEITSAGGSHGAHTGNNMSNNRNLAAVNTTINFYGCTSANTYQHSPGVNSTAPQLPETMAPDLAALGHSPLVLSVLKTTLTPMVFNSTPP